MEKTKLKSHYNNLLDSLKKLETIDINEKLDHLLYKDDYKNKENWLLGLALCDYGLSNNSLVDKTKALYIRLFKRNWNLYYSSFLDQEDYEFWFKLCERINDGFLDINYHKAYVERDYILENARRPFRNRSKSREYLLKGIELGDAACRAVYGYNLFFGARGEVENKEEGLKLIQEAKELGYDQAENCLLNIVFYTEEDNTYVLEKIKEQIESKEKESEKPYHLLAEYYLYREQNIEQALEVLHKGIEVNNPYSKYIFGINILNERLQGYTVEQGICLLEEAYEYGIIYAANWLGRYYYYIQAENHSLEKSIQWHERAKLYYFEDSLVELSLIYLYEEEVQDVEKGKIYLNWAVQEGNARAMSEKAHWLLNNENSDPKEVQSLLEDAMELGDSYAPYRLGRLYETGYFGEPDYYKAFELVKIAAERGHVYGLEMMGHYYRVGITSQEESDPEKAIEYLNKAIEMGSEYAQVEMAFCYEAGFGVEKNYVQAYDLFERAAVNGYIYAYNKLGYYEEDGLIGEKNPQKAFEYFQKAAEGENVEGYYNLGRAYKYTIGIPENPELALENYRKAAEFKYGEACIELALSYEDEYGGLSFDESKIMSYMLVAAEQGYPFAQYKVGCYYYYGLIENNREKALEWLSISCQSGYPYAALFLGDYYLYDAETDNNKAFEYYCIAEENGIVSEGLGVCYEYGIGVDENSQEAFRWYKFAAEKGSIGSKYRLGLAYKYGMGTEENLAESFVWFQDAAQEGNFHAQYHAAMMLLKGEGVEQDLNKAITLLLEIAEKGHIEAQFELGNCYLIGKGVEEDEVQAMAWYQKAAENGHEQSLKITGKRERRRR
ncbi:tetratricopeptide repeat protein [Apibacter sp. HY039]|uniref:tetratricopeptide repeat protein n=1 Tax=Apibacter sp. HY039 TaxID=2501476 RepID=UPI000FEBC3E7|nr:tetratricopeptide repeat protein [Apibacter sp. HY039]